jgi:hypothetical protein
MQDVQEFIDTLRSRIVEGKADSFDRKTLALAEELLGRMRQMKEADKNYAKIYPEISCDYCSAKFSDEVDLAEHWYDKHASDHVRDIGKRK